MLTGAGAIEKLRRAMAKGADAAQGVLARLRAGDVKGVLTQHADVALAGLVVAIVAMMIVPLPTFLLDLLVTANIALAVTLLLVALYVSDALRIATFPTLLLLATLFRLSIEVSATRLILVKADAGHVIRAFGDFVVAGNLVVGVVVFVILTLIQFIVIAKGSERVAEVGARFTLDAMPGKQMSIDAELRAGHIDHAEARRRRAQLARESQFFGAMDGAMKFVKGDAIAGIVVLAVNIVGGLIVGVLQRGMDAGVAAKTYTILTIGEGLVAQIPAILVSTAAGILVTRVSSEEEGAHLGRDIVGQVLAQPKALAVGAGLLALFALVPGLPAAPFLVLAAAFGLVARTLLRAEKDQAKNREGAALVEAQGTRGGARADAVAKADAFSPVLVPFALELGESLGAELVGSGGPSRLMTELVPALRERFFAETGIPLPAVRVRPSAAGVPPRGYVVRMQEVVMGRGDVPVGCVLALAEPDRIAELEVEAQATKHPDGSEAAWVPAGSRGVLADERIGCLGADEVVLSHLLAVARRHAHELLGIQETQALLEALERTHPALVREVVPKLVTPVLLTDVLRRLAEEGISLRALREILGALAEWAPIERDPVALTEHVRQALRRHITQKFAGATGGIAGWLLDPIIEDTVREAIQKTATGSYLALAPELARDVVNAVARVVGPAGKRGAGAPPVLLTGAEVRRYVRRLVEGELPRVVVLSFQELAPEAAIQPLGRIGV